MGLIARVPDEILDSVFTHLSHLQDAIATCRLVNHRFNRVSSPYLITTVVFARRVQAITRLKRIMAHEYFHRHVTELMVDISSFDEQCATDWEFYREECSNAFQLLVNSRVKDGRTMEVKQVGTEDQR